MSDVIFIRFSDKKLFTLTKLKNSQNGLADISKHLLQQRITTSEQNAVFVQSDGDRRRVGYTSVIFVDLGVEIDGAYYCDSLLSQQLLPAIRHVSSEFIL